MKKIFAFVCCLSTPVMSDNVTVYSEISDYIRIQGKCSSYAKSTRDDFKLAGFESKKNAQDISEKHLQLTTEGAEKLVKFIFENEIDGKIAGFKKNNQYCFGAFCVAKKEYLEALFLMDAIESGDKEVMTEKITCPNGTWEPCIGRVSPDLWPIKSVNLYREKNCSLFLKLRLE